MKTFAKIKDYIRLLRVKYIHNRVCFTSPLHMSGQTVIVAPHPDDEVLGCGGLITRLVNEGQPPYVILMTGGGRSHYGCCDLTSEVLIENRRNLTLNALKILGVPSNHIKFLNFPDGEIAINNADLQSLQKLLNDLRPSTVFVPHAGEGWSDHVETRNLVNRLLVGKKDVTLYEYCVWFWYYNSKPKSWRAASLLKMSPTEYIHKQKAIDAYILPQAPCGNPWSGILPPVFVKACRWDKELYFKMK